MRWLYGFVSLLFMSFAAVQFNDPDGLVWIAAYLFAALVSIPPIFGRHTFLPGIGLAVYLAWGISLIGFVDTNWLEIEEARESLGLLIATFWMGVLFYIYIRKRSEAKSRTGDQ